MRVPWQLTLQAVTDPMPGKGFEPDVAAPLTYGAWLAGRDPVMEKALELSGRGVEPER